MRCTLLCFIATCTLTTGTAPADVTRGLVGHWKLAGDCRDASGAGNHGKNHGATLDAQCPDGRPGLAAQFDGRDDYIEVPNAESLQFGSGDFSISAWIHTKNKLDDVLGDILSQFDPASRRGLNFTIQNFAGVTSTQSNDRNLFFGIDNGVIDPKWTDCGRPGNNLFVFALCVHQGELYAGTFEFEKNEAGHVYRYAGGKKWVDCGQPDQCNAVGSLAVFNGQLYAGASHYRSSGSALPESPNDTPGGKVYRYEGGTRWSDCGKLRNSESGDADTIGGLVVYNGQLYAGVSKPPGRGLYRYDGEQSWTYCGNPGHRVTYPAVYNGHIYFASLDGGGVTRYEGGQSFTKCGQPEGVSQTYGFAIHGGDLYASSWPNGEVFRYGGDTAWTNCGRLGEEKEVMGMMVYNGKLYAGTLPLAQVYRYEGGSEWTLTGQLDTTPDVRYRRAWSMAVFAGKLYCGTLPSGHVYAIEAGKSVTHDHPLEPGWRHVAAIRQGAQLSLYIDARRVATSTTFDPADYDLSNAQPLRIGTGAHDHFNGAIRDLRIHRRALDATELQTLYDDWPHVSRTR